MVMSNWSPAPEGDGAHLTGIEAPGGGAADIETRPPSPASAD